MDAVSVKKVLQSQGDPLKAVGALSFFKTGKGQYGEGDRFFGITVPTQRKTARRFVSIPLDEVEKLLKDGIHECRFTALEILVMKFEAAAKVGNKAECTRLAKFYLSHAKHANNWDLVDTSAPYILGRYLFEYVKDRTVLYRLAKSKNLWERRIAIVSTYYFIGEKDFKDTIRIAEILLDDDHDLIHKATGWMLREMGKRDEQLLVSFLEKHAATMPRTMLRYAIERFAKKERVYYLALKASAGQ
ncbi:MAG: DNA alkylation repair protein [Patescibacteria group bacterium]